MITKARKYVLIVLFLVLIFFPSMLGLLGVHLGNGLGGVVAAGEEPDLSVKSVMDGTWLSSG